jgi:predicted RNA binding protein YcfA (HicA-like mRNA interferase family)
VRARKLPRDLSGMDFRKAVSRIGFEFKRQRGSHMVLFRAHPPTTLIVPDHGALKLGLLRKLVDQAGLTTDEFLSLLR